MQMLVQEIREEVYGEESAHTIHITVG